GGRQVGVDHAAPVLVLHAQGETVSGDPRVVDEDVQPAEAVDDRLDQVLAGPRVRHGGPERLGLATLGPQRGDELPRRPRRGGVVDGHPVTQFAEERCRVPTDASAGARDDDRAAFPLHHSASTSSIPSGSATEAATAPSTVRLIRFVSTSPEPNSRKTAWPSVAP